jgi:hypothetical protein
VNDTLQKSLASALQTVLDGLKAGYEFGSKEIPLILAEKLRYELAVASFETVVFLVGGIGVIVTVRKLWAFHKKDTFNNDDAALGAVLTGALGGGFFVFGFIYNLEQALKIYLAPRIYLLDWLVELLKK